MKKRMSWFAILAVMSAAIAVGAPVLAAQDTMGASPAGGGADRAEAMQKLEKMSAALNLSPTQKQQMLPILMEEAPKLKALKANTSLGPVQKAMQMRQIANATDTKVKPILSVQQYQTWEQMRAQERQQMMQKMEQK